MKKNRINRVNSLLKEVISEVIRKDIYDPEISNFLTITKVSVSKDLRNAKVYVSVIGDNREKTINALQQKSKEIYAIASKKVVLRYFPVLTFLLDDSMDKLQKIEDILKDIKKNV
ncbi:MAG: ribosome-binding factor A [Chlamydiae bacterium SM23_39]|nr:MAG: ribosome-binding factor A [Chlamydiae bacterium SM23_39]